MLHYNTVPRVDTQRMSFLLDKKKSPEGPLVWVFAERGQLSGCKTRVIGVALDTMSKVESQLKMHNYDGFFK